jgi:hypothetical protein
MPDDFPAAHSIDTQWFAVDADGRVAVLHSGEEGPVPEWLEQHQPAVIAWLHGLSPQAAADQWWAPQNDDFRRLGLFVYSYEHDHWGGWFAWAYEREVVPDVPLHIDQLPPQIREIFARVRFDKLRFADSAHVQPVDFFPCGLWDDEPGYLASDGQTIRAVPGEEESFRDWYNCSHPECVRANPEVAGLRVELPPGSPPPDEDENEDD